MENIVLSILSIWKQQLWTIIRMASIEIIHYVSIQLVGMPRICHANITMVWNFFSSLHHKIKRSCNSLHQYGINKIQQNLNGILITTHLIEVLASSFFILDWKNSWKMPCSIPSVCLTTCIVPIFWSLLMAFVGKINICWGLFSLTWKFFICSDIVFPPLLNIIPLVGLSVLIEII